MTNPYLPPESSSEPGLESEMTLEGYWKMVQRRRNQFIYFLLILFVLNLALNISGVEVNDGLLIFLFGVLSLLIVIVIFWLGYRVVNVRCFQCGHKLATGHFFFLKNVRCLGCGFSYNGT